MSASNLDAAFGALYAEPARAEALCRSALADRDDPGARLMLAAALRLQGKAPESYAQTIALAKAFPNWGAALLEHAMAAAALERHAEALDYAAQSERLGVLPGFYRIVGDQHWAMGDRVRAEQAYLRHLASQAPEFLVQSAAQAMRAGDRGSAEQALRAQLGFFAGDVLAMRLLAELLSARDAYEESERWLRACLERAPSFALGRFGLAMVLVHDHRIPPALEQIDVLLADEPDRYEYLNLKADALGRLGLFEAAAECLARIVALRPGDGAAWSNYGHILRTLGQRDACEDAYKRAIATGMGVGEAYWGLANLKTLKFDDADIQAMRDQSQRAEAASPDRTSLLFALGKALEDRAAYADAFAAYDEANASQRARAPYDAKERTEAVRRARAVFTPDFLSMRQDFGRSDSDPIFILGMPRSGSTLVEQIVASHSRVEGTMELVELLAITKRLEKQGGFPEVLRDATAEQCDAWGAEYLERTRPFRKTNAPHFIDKMPNNFTQLGFILLTLPNARIIDVRRNPMACSFSIFKQHWATGQNFAYGLEDIGHFYRAYVELMAHFDAAAPGRVHRVIYEDMIAQPEVETRRLLDACGLTFEEQCLRFYENKRAVRTPSSEQVRRPINMEGLDAWRPFEPWLEPLKKALGPVLEAYPRAPG